MLSGYIFGNDRCGCKVDFDTGVGWKLSANGVKILLNDCGCTTGNVGELAQVVSCDCMIL
jgi:hypothetical protein